MVGRTKDGFEIEVDERVLSDWDFAMAVAEVQSAADDFKRLAAAGRMVNLLLGAAGTEKLKEHIRANNDGFVPAELIVSSVTEIMNSVKETKN